ncbi:unnamed protein product [Cercospora beticola]|nr:unnamed protein product [Cercospora beticola]
MAEARASSLLDASGSRACWQNVSKTNILDIKILLHAFPGVTVYRSRIRQMVMQKEKILSAAEPQIKHEIRVKPTRKRLMKPPSRARFPPTPVHHCRSSTSPKT